MQRMQLNAVNARLNHLLERLQAFALPFPGQADNQVTAHLQAAFTCQTRRILVTGKVVAAVNPVQRFIVRGLQPQLQPHFIALLVVLTQQV